MRYTLTLTDKCNKNCAFCYENAIRQNISLSESTLYKQLARIMSTDTKTPKKISFFGGEPFIELDLMKKTANVLKQYNKYNADNPITLSFITNGNNTAIKIHLILIANLGIPKSEVGNLIILLIVKKSKISA